MRFLPLALVLTLVPWSVRAADPTYEVVKTDAKGPVGTPLKASVTVKAKQGWHLNKEAPFTLKLSPATGVETPKAKLIRADLAESNEDVARFEVPFTVVETGRKTVEAEAGFVLCQDEACRPIREKVSLVVDGAEAAKPAESKAKVKGPKKKS
jgi:hypothetical protein